MEKKIMKRVFFLLLISMWCQSMVFSQSQGKTMFVTVNSAVLKSSTGFFSRTVGTLALGTAVTVIRESGKWMEVRTGNALSGWIGTASLSSKRIASQSSNSATAGEIALAGKGFTKEVEIEYRKNGLNYSAVDAMENLTIPGEELLRFVNDGRLSKGE
jgi:uncharacterized protein YgiM (DUF1202 family)